MEKKFRSEEDQFEDRLPRTLALALCPVMALLHHLSPLSYSHAEDFRIHRSNAWRGENRGPRTIHTFSRDFYWHANALNHIFHLFNLTKAILRAIRQNKCLVVCVVDHEELVNFPSTSHVITHKDTTPENIEQERLRRKECALQFSREKEQRKKRAQKPPVRKKKKVKKDISKEKKK